MAPKDISTAYWSFFTITIIVIFVPLSPRMPVSGVDASWELDMNQAVFQDFNFGEDIIFTYGPYASILTIMYHPATDQLMLWGSFLLAIVYSMALIYLATGVSYVWLLLIALFLLVPTFRDTMFFSLPLILSLVIYRVTLPDTHPRKLSRQRYMGIKMFGLFFSLGLLPAMKGTMLVLVFGNIALSALMLWKNQLKSLALAVITAPMLSFLLFWSIAGQAWSALPKYLISLEQIISGYTEAMSLLGDLEEIYLFIAATAMILVAILADKSSRFFSKSFLLLTYVLFIFVAFKSGFVRHDGHALIAASAIAISAMLLPFVNRSKLVFLSLFLSMFVWGIIVSHYREVSPNVMYASMAGRYRNAWHGFRIRVTEENYLNEEYDNSLAKIRNQFFLPAFEGTTDIYSTHQAYLIASDNVWKPKPVVQSYSAYTPLLAELNDNHLKGDEAPDNILFIIEAIDGRLPALEDGLSWPTILNRYSIQNFIGPYIHFKKRALSTSGEEILNKTNIVYNDVHILNNWFELPDTEKTLFAKVSIESTTLGKIYSLLYKPPQMRMVLLLANGEKKFFRVVCWFTVKWNFGNPVIVHNWSPKL